MKQIALTELNVFFDKVAEKCALYIPVDNGADQSVYVPYSSGMQYSRKLNTERSAKDFFLPQIENLMEFKMDGKKITVVDNRNEAEDFVVFGVRACDAKSFEILDKVYLADPVDTYYQNRRNHGIIITVACSAPTEYRKK